MTLRARRRSTKMAPGPSSPAVPCRFRRAHRDRQSHPSDEAPSTRDHLRGGSRACLGRPWSGGTRSPAWCLASDGRRDRSRELRSGHGPRGAADASRHSDGHARGHVDDAPLRRPAVVVPLSRLLSAGGLRVPRARTWGDLPVVLGRDLRVSTPLSGPSPRAQRATDPRAPRWRAAALRSGSTATRPNAPKNVREARAGAGSRRAFVRRAATIESGC